MPALLLSSSGGTVHSSPPALAWGRFFQKSPSELGGGLETLVLGWPPRGGLGALGVMGESHMNPLCFSLKCSQL